MLNKDHIRALVFIGVAGLHLILLLFLAFNVQTMTQQAPENARVMKVTDLAEEQPPPPPPPPPEAEPLPEVESIAENMIETETEPLQTIVDHGTIITPQIVIDAEPSFDDYLPIHKVSDPPRFDEREIAAALVYPPIAQRSGIEGRVILELFVDKNGFIQQIRVLQENPKERGFAEAAVKAFTGRKGTPARANGEPVFARYRYPVSFRIK